MSWREQIIFDEMMMDVFFDFWIHKKKYRCRVVAY